MPSVHGSLKTKELKFQGSKQNADFSIKVEDDALSIKRGNANLMVISVDDESIFNEYPDDERMTINAPVTFTNVLTAEGAVTLKDELTAEGAVTLKDELTAEGSVTLKDELLCSLLYYQIQLH